MEKVLGLVNVEVLRLGIVFTEDNHGKHGIG